MDMIKLYISAISPDPWFLLVPYYIGHMLLAGKFIYCLEGRKSIIPKSREREVFHESLEIARDIYFTIIITSITPAVNYKLFIRRSLYLKVGTYSTKNL